jgi:hypothetical protein
MTIPEIIEDLQIRQSSSSKPEELRLSWTASANDCTVEERRFSAA